MTAPIGEEFIKIRPDLSGFRAELQAQVATALQGVQTRVPTGAAAATAKSAVAPAEPVISNLRKITTATDRAADAQRRLENAAKNAKAPLAGIVLPAGVRDVVSVSQSAAAAQANLAKTAQVTKQQLAGIVLPPGIRSVTVATEEAAAAQTKLATSARAAKAAVGSVAAAPAPLAAGQRTVGRVIVPQSRNLAATATATRQAAEAAAALGTSATKASKGTQDLTDHSRVADTVTRKLGQGLNTAERDVSRYTRGMVAATAASTGFFRAVSFASGAFLVGAAVGAAIGTAINEFKNMVTVAAQTNALIKATGGAAHVSADQVSSLATSLQNLTGIDDEQIKAASNVLLTFRGIRNEGEGLNAVFDRSTKAVLDISSVMGTDLLGTAKQVGKALQDPVKGITALRRAGVTFSQSERDLVKRLVETGRTLEAQKFILAGIEGQIGGTAEAVGKTLPGRLAILREASKNALGEYVKRISESEKATELFKQASQGISQTFNEVKRVVAALGPPLLNVASGLARVTQAVGGVSTILAVAAAYKAVTIGARLATGATTLFATASASGAAAATLAAVAADADAAAMTALATSQTAAAASAQRTLGTMTALSAVFAVGAIASGQWTLAVIASGAALATFAARIIAIRRAMIELTGAAAASRVALAAFGGPLGVAALAVGALAGGLVLLSRKMGPAAGSSAAFSNALDGLSASIQNLRRVTGEAAGASEDVTIARQRQIAATSAVDDAERKLGKSTAQAGSPENLFFTSQLNRARRNLRETTIGLRDAEVKRDKNLENQRRAQAEVARQTTDTTKKIRAQLDATKRDPFIRRGPFNIPISFTLIRPTFSAETQFKNVAKVFDDLAKSTDPVKRKIGEVGTAIQTIQDKKVTPKQIDIIMRLVGEGASVNQILSVLGIKRGGPAGGREQLRLRGIQSQEEINQAAEDEFKAQRAILRTLREKLTLANHNFVVQKQTTQQARDAESSARDALTNAKEGVISANRALSDAHEHLRDAITSLADAVKTAHESIVNAIKAARDAANEAVNSAKSNLQSMGQALADMLGQARDELGKTDQIGGELSARFKELARQVRAGQGSAGTQKAAQQLAAATQGPTTALDTEKLQRRFTNLTDAFGRGLITLPQFNRRLQQLFSGAGIDLKQLQKIDPALARKISDYLRFIRQQARAIPVGRRRGGTDNPEIVDVRAVIKQGAKDIANARIEAAKTIEQATRAVRDASRDVGDAEKAVARAIKDVKDAEKDLTKATNELRKEQRIQERLHRRALNLNRKAVEANTKAQTQANGVVDPPRKNKTKPAGTSNQNSTTTTTKAGIGTGP